MSNPEPVMSPSDYGIDFLFGNIDNYAKLEDEDDTLDPESKRHLSKLGTLAGLTDTVKEIFDEKDCYADGDDEGSGEKASDAVDYSYINELAKDESYDQFREAMSAVPPKQDSENNEDYDDVDGTEVSQSASDLKMTPPPPSPIERKTSPPITPPSSTVSDGGSLMEREDDTIIETGDNVTGEKAQREALKTLQNSSKEMKSHCPSGGQIILSEQWPNKKRKRLEGQENTSPAKRPSSGKQGRKSDKENIPSP